MTNGLDAIDYALFAVIGVALGACPRTAYGAVSSVYGPFSSTENHSEKALQRRATSWSFA